MSSRPVKIIGWIVCYTIDTGAAHTIADATMVADDLRCLHELLPTRTQLIPFQIKLQFLFTSMSYNFFPHVLCILSFFKHIWRIHKVTASSSIFCFQHEGDQFQYIFSWCWAAWNCITRLYLSSNSSKSFLISAWSASTTRFFLAPGGLTKSYLLCISCSFDPFGFLVNP